MEEENKKEIPDFINEMMGDKREEPPKDIFELREFLKKLK